MKFHQPEKRIRILGTAYDHGVLPGLFMLAWIDGRNFKRPTREMQHFDASSNYQMRDHASSLSAVPQLSMDVLRVIRNNLDELPSEKLVITGHLLLSPSFPAEVSTCAVVLVNDNADTQ